MRHSDTSRFSGMARRYSRRGNMTRREWVTVMGNVDKERMGYDVKVVAGLLLTQHLDFLEDVLDQVFVRVNVDKVVRSVDMEATNFRDLNIHRQASLSIPLALYFSNYNLDYVLDVFNEIHNRVGNEKGSKTFKQKALVAFEEHSKALIKDEFSKPIDGRTLNSIIDDVRDSFLFFNKLDESDLSNFKFTVLEANIDSRGTALVQRLIPGSDTPKDFNLKTTHAPYELSQNIHVLNLALQPKG